MSDLEQWAVPIVVIVFVLSLIVSFFSEPSICHRITDPEEQSRCVEAMDAIARPQWE